MKRLTTLAAVMIAAAAFAKPATFKTADGISCSVTQNGLIKDVSYRGEKFINYLNMVGSYVGAEKGKKNGQFYQQHNYNDIVKIKEQTAEKLAYTVEGKLSCNEFKPGVLLKVDTVITKDKIQLAYRIELLPGTTLGCRYINGIFKSEVHCVPAFYGAGMKVTDANKKSQFIFIPKTFNSKFNMPEAVLTELAGKANAMNIEVKPGENTRISFADARAWGGKEFFFCIHPLSQWSPRVEVYKPGTVWTWNYTITFRKMK